jgi:hypothetical protein
MVTDRVAREKGHNTNGKLSEIRAKLFFDKDPFGATDGVREAALAPPVNRGALGLSIASLNTNKSSSSSSSSPECSQSSVSHIMYIILYYVIHKYHIIMMSYYTSLTPESFSTYICRQCVLSVYF